jgi:two-component system, sensor histidine kinase
VAPAERPSGTVGALDSQGLRKGLYTPFKVDPLNPAPPLAEWVAAPPDREILVELLLLHARVLRRMPYVETLLVLGMALFMYPYIPTRIFLGWGCVTVGVEITRAWYATRLLNRPAAVNPRRTHLTFMLMALAAGGAVGCGSIFFFPRLPILDQALLGAIMFAMPAAGVAVSQSSRYIVAAYAFSMLIPACATWMYLHPSQALALAVLMILYCVVIILAAADCDRVLLRSVMIRNERDRLIRDLEQRNTEVRAAMATAEQSAQARARVLAAASHDLRQPLHALSVYTAVLAANPAPEALREVATNIDQIVRSLGSLLHGLLDLSRLSTGHFALEKRTLALDKTVGAVCAEFQRAASAQGLDLIVKVEPVQTVGDPLAIARITRNLLDNALKYTERGSITVTVTAGNDSTDRPGILTIEDTGKGIPASEHARIFEEFYQLDNPGRDRSKGVGLGLTIVQRLCELSGALVSVTSEPGRGTSFQVRFPGIADAPEPSETSQQTQADVSLRGLRVYLVDDETDILRSMKHLLTAWGMECLPTDSAAGAELLFQDHGKPHLLITDLRLGKGEHGAEFALRMRHKWGRFPVLIITGETSSTALRDANERGFPLLQKPVVPETLREAIVAQLAPPTSVQVDP